MTPIATPLPTQSGTAPRLNRLAPVPPRSRPLVLFTVPEPTHTDWHALAERYIEHPEIADKMPAQPARVDGAAAYSDWHHYAADFQAAVLMEAMTPET